MKNQFLTIIIVLLGIVKSYGQGHVQPGQSASHSVVKFEEVTYDFGNKIKGSDVSHKFEFKNISKQRIGITDVKTSCGCTTPKYSTDPIKPGKKGIVEAKYDSNLGGVFIKSLTVMLNDGEQIILTIKGNIIVPNAGAALPK